MSTPTPYAKYIRSRLTIERMRLIVPLGDSRQVANELYGSGWRLVKVGPLRKSYLEVDGSRQEIIAERKVDAVNLNPPPGRKLPLGEAIDKANAKYGGALRRLED